MTPRPEMTLRPGMTPRPEMTCRPEMTPRPEMTHRPGTADRSGGGSTGVLTGSLARPAPGIPAARRDFRRRSHERTLGGVQTPPAGDRPANSRFAPGSASKGPPARLTAAARAAPAHGRPAPEPQTPPRTPPDTPGRRSPRKSRFPAWFRTAACQVTVLFFAPRGQSGFSRGRKPPENKQLEKQPRRGDRKSAARRVLPFVEPRPISRAPAPRNAPCPPTPDPPRADHSIRQRRNTRHSAPAASGQLPASGCQYRGQSCPRFSAQRAVTGYRPPASGSVFRPASPDPPSLTAFPPCRRPAGLLRFRRGRERTARPAAGRKAVRAGTEIASWPPPAPRGGRKRQESDKAVWCPQISLTRPRRRIFRPFDNPAEYEAPRRSRAAGLVDESPAPARKRGAGCAVARKRDPRLGGAAWIGRATGTTRPGRKRGVRLGGRPSNSGTSTGVAFRQGLGDCPIPESAKGGLGACGGEARMLLLDAPGRITGESELPTLSGS